MAMPFIEVFESQHKMSINSNNCRLALYNQIHQKCNSGKYRRYKLQAMFQITEVNLISKKLSQCNIYFNHLINYYKLCLKEF